MTKGKLLNHEELVDAIESILPRIYLETRKTHTEQMRDDLVKLFESQKAIYKDINIDVDKVKVFLTKSYEDIASGYYWEGTFDSDQETKEWVEENLPKLLEIIKGRE